MTTKRIKKCGEDLVIYGIYWEFDRILFRPVEIRFRGTNTDGWLRFEYTGDTSSCNKYTAAPPTILDKAVFSSRTQCVKHMISRLWGRL